MKEFICNFEINDKIYRIYNVDKIEGKKTFVGETNYDNRTVFIESGKYENMILTLIHELTHVWLYEIGHKTQDNGCFSYEDVCEIVAYSKNFIDKIVNKYIFYT